MSFNKYDLVSHIEANYLKQEVLYSLVKEDQMSQLFLKLLWPATLAQ